MGAVVADRASSTSQAVADVLLLGGVAGVENLPFLLYKAHQTQRVVKQGMVIALGTLSCAAFLATAGVIPLYAPSPPRPTHFERVRHAGCVSSHELCLQINMIECCPCTATAKHKSICFLDHKGIIVSKVQLTSFAAASAKKGECEVVNRYCCVAGG